MALLTDAGLITVVDEDDENSSSSSEEESGGSKKNDASCRAETRQKWLLGLEYVRTGAALEADPWAHLAITDRPTEYCRRYDFDVEKQIWVKTETLLKAEATPFAEGAMRECYRMKKMSQRVVSHFFRQDWERASNYVMKRYKNTEGLSRKKDRARYFDDVQMQMESKFLGQLFTNERKPPKKVDFLHCFVIELPHRPGAPTFAVERFMGEGTYIKYNSNSGFVEHESPASLDGGKDVRTVTRMTPQAFSQFTFERTGGCKMVVDVQGVDDLYTDPQLHTIDGKGYGEGNLGISGMALFFSTKHFTSLDAHLSLRRFDLSPTLADRAMRHHYATCEQNGAFAATPAQSDVAGSPTTISEFWTAKVNQRLSAAIGHGATNVPCADNSATVMRRPPSVRDLAATVRSSKNASSKKSLKQSNNIVDTAMRSFANLWSNLLVDNESSSANESAMVELPPAPLAALPLWAMPSEGDRRWGHWQDAAADVRARRVATRAQAEKDGLDLEALLNDADFVEASRSRTVARVHEELARRCATGMLPATEQSVDDPSAFDRPPPDPFSALWHAAHAARGGASVMACRAFRDLMRGVTQDHFPGLVLELDDQHKSRIDGLDSALCELAAAAGDPSAAHELAQLRLASGDVSSALALLEDLETTRAQWEKESARNDDGGDGEGDDDDDEEEEESPMHDAEMASRTFWDDMGGPSKHVVLTLMADIHLAKSPSDTSSAYDCLMEASELAMNAGAAKLGMKLMERAESLP
ncbi:elongation factor 2 kinase [Pycnococcus provasolii]